MLKYLVKRIGTAVITLFVAATITFFVMNLVPGDPFMSVKLGAIEAEIRSRGYYMMIYTTDDISELIRNILTWNVDGLLLIGIVHDDFVRIKSRYKKPVTDRQLCSKGYYELCERRA